MTASDGDADIPWATGHGVRSERGLFVVFEGGDGVGKSTQVDRLVRTLTDRGVDVVRTHEPGDSAAGAQIRRIVLDPATGDLSPRAEALLYAADKAHHLFEVVHPALDRGAVVVCDRYVDSMLAYQGAGRVLDVGEVERIARWATGDLRPHLTIVLDADPLRAVHEKLEKDRVEAAGDSFHERARQYFLDLAAADPGHYLVLDGRDTIAAISASIEVRVSALIGQRSGSSGRSSDGSVDGSVGNGSSNGPAEVSAPSGTLAP